MPHAFTSPSGLGALLRRAIDSIDLTFCKLNRIQFSAPWKQDTRGC